MRRQGKMEIGHGEFHCFLSASFNSRLFSKKDNENSMEGFKNTDGSYINISQRYEQVLL